MGVGGRGEGSGEKMNSTLDRSKQFKIRIKKCIDKGFTA